MHDHNQASSTNNYHQPFPEGEHEQAPPTLLPGILARLGIGDSSSIPATTAADDLLQNTDMHPDSALAHIFTLHQSATRGIQVPLEPLLAALHNADPFVRAAAVQTLGTLPSDQISIKHFVSTLHDPSWYVRASTVLALANQTSDSYQSLLLTALDDPDSSVSDAARQVIHRSSDQKINTTVNTKGYVSMENTQPSSELDQQSLTTDPHKQPLSTLPKIIVQSARKPTQPLLESGSISPVRTSGTWKFINIIAAIIGIVILAVSLVGGFRLLEQNYQQIGDKQPPFSFSTGSGHIIYQLSGTSMEPALLPGIRIDVNSSTYAYHLPRRGDIIAFRAPFNHTLVYIKRVIAIPGDYITIKGTTVILNGKILSEPYVDPQNQGNRYTRAVTNLLIPANAYFVLGDNRRESSDSRDWGLVPAKNIIGQVILP